MTPLSIAEHLHVIEYAGSSFCAGFVITVHDEVVFERVKDEDRFFLLDCDIVALRRFDDEQQYMIQHADLIVYDISDQVFSAYGAKRIKADIEAVAGEILADPRWFGGEFIGGSRKGLSQLIEKAKGVLPYYLTMFVRCIMWAMKCFSRPV
jgi:hypothetical protein